MDSQPLVDAVRAIAVDQPDTTERLSHGAPAWFIGKAPQFAGCMVDHHGVDGVTIWAACPSGAREPLVQDDPEIYFVPPYVGTRGWIGMRIDDRTDWDAVADLLDDAWHTVATPAQRRRHGR